MTKAASGWARVRKDDTTEWVVDPDNLRRARLRCDVFRWLLSRWLRDTDGVRNWTPEHSDPGPR